MLRARNKLPSYPGSSPSSLPHAFLSSPLLLFCNVHSLNLNYHRAYVVPTNPKILTSPSQKSKYEKQVEEWIKTKVAKHKFLRGGVRAVDIIPKRCVFLFLESNKSRARLSHGDGYSGAGKILRRQLRDLAQAEAKQDLERDLAGTTGGPMSKL